MYPQALLTYLGFRDISPQTGNRTYGTPCSYRLTQMLHFSMHISILGNVIYEKQRGQLKLKVGEQIIPAAVAGV